MAAAAKEPDTPNWSTFFNVDGVPDIRDLYVSLERLGSGGFGDVFKATKADGSIVAVKLMHVDPARDRGAHVGEAANNYGEFKLVHDVLNSCAHPGLICYHKIGRAIIPGSLETAHFYGDTVCVYIEMDYIPGNTLHDIIGNKKIPTPLILKFARHMFGALAIVHAKGVAHRDLKPSNIMFTEDKLVIVDFGLACIFRDVEQAPRVKCDNWSRAGTHGYKPPEFFNGEDLPRDYTFQSQDMYAMGVIIDKMLQEGHIAAYSYDKVTQELLLKYIVTPCTAANYRDRPTANECLRRVTIIAKQMEGP